MGRVTYLHHYVPAVVFLAPLAGVVLDTITDVIAATAVLVQRWWRGRGHPDAKVGLPAAATAPRPVLAHLAWPATAVVAAVFWQFRAIAYGMTGPMAIYAHLQWLPGWNIVDAS